MPTIACDGCMRTGVTENGALFDEESGQWIICASCLKSKGKDQVLKGLRARKRGLTGPRSDVLNDASDRELVTMVRWGEADALDELTTRHSRLIYHRATKVTGMTALDIEDLVQIATIGFIKGVSTYNLEAEAKLTTHCTWTIRHALSEAIQKFSTVDMGFDTYWNIRKMERLDNELYQSLKREPTDQELADEMNKTVGVGRNLTAEDVRRVKTAAWEADDPVSFDEPLSDVEGDDGEALYLEDIVASDYNLEEDYMKKEEIELALAGVSSLPTEQREVVTLRYIEGLTYEEISAKLGISRRTIVRRERDALTTLQADLA